MSKPCYKYYTSKLLLPYAFTQVYVNRVKLSFIHTYRHLERYILILFTLFFKIVYSSIKIELLRILLNHAQSNDVIIEFNIAISVHIT